MHLEYQALLQADPELEARLKRLPGAIFSGRKRPAKGVRGVFFCYALPALDREAGEFTEEAGTTRWYLLRPRSRRDSRRAGEIVASIRSKPDTPRKCTTEEKTLIEMRAKIEKHIKNTYLKRVDAPVGVKPTLKCWMELNEAEPMPTDHRAMLGSIKTLRPTDRLPARRDGLADCRDVIRGRDDL